MQRLLIFVILLLVFCVSASEMQITRDALFGSPAVSMTAPATVIQTMANLIPSKTPAGMRMSASAAPSVEDKPNDNILYPVWPTATATSSLADRLRDNIVFYLIQPAAGQKEACGAFTLVPIISYRLRTGDRIQDVQIALNMLFSLKNKIYLKYYNALWDTDLSIESYQYIKQKDYMIIDFAGYLSAGQLSNCDKHGIREQIWATFFHYGIREKTFKINGVFLIDQLNRKTHE